MPDFVFPSEVEFQPPPAVLYKFRTFPDLRNLTEPALGLARQAREAVLDTVLRGKVYLSSPESFTDPFDCYAESVPRYENGKQQERAVVE